MKKILLALLVLSLFLFGTATTQAANVNVNWVYDTIANTLQPVQNAWSAVVRGSSFTATSTTQTNTFPLLTTNTATATTICLTGDSCRSTWPSGGSGSTTTINGVQGNTFIFATGTATGIGLTLSTTTGTVTFTPVISSGYIIPRSASTTEWAAAYASTTAMTPAYFRGLFSASSPITYNSGTGAFTFDNTGNWAGTLGGSTLANILNRTNHTGTQSSTTITGLGTLAGLSSVNLATNVTGNLPVTNLNSGTGASSTSFWAGDGTWRVPAGGGGGSSNWTDNGTYLTPLTSTDGILVTGSSTFNALNILNSTTTGNLNIKSNKFNEHAAGFLDLQRAGTDYTLMRVRAPRGSSKEATLSLVNDMSATDAGVDEEFVDFYNENYGDSRQWGLRQAYSGTGQAKPFVIGFWQTAGAKDVGNSLIILPSGTVAVARATSTVPQNTMLYVASSSATNLIRVDAAVGTTLFTIANNGSSTIGGGSTTTGLTINGGATTTSLKLTSLRDSSNSLGTIGQILQSTGSTANWISTSTLAIALSDTIGVLAATRGGTAQSTYTTGDTLYASAANTLSKLGIGSTGNVLSVVGGIPTWVATSTLGLGGGGGGSGTVNSGTQGQVAYYASNGTAVSGTSTLFIASDGKVGIGTTTPPDKLTVQVANNQGIEVISSNSAFIGYGKIGADRFRMQNDFTNVGLFEILYNNGTGGPAGTNILTLTGTGSGIAGRMGINDTAPTANLSVAGNLAGTPIADFFASTGSTTMVVSQATTTVRHSSTLSGFLQSSLARLTVGIDNLIGYYRSGRLFGALTIKGLFFQEEWKQVDCSSLVGATQIIADGLTGCDGFAFYEDGTATLTSTANGGQVYSRLGTSATADGAGVFVNAPTGGFLIMATSTPVFETTARIHTVQNQGTTTQTFIGFTNLATAGTTFETAPTAGCFFTASTTIANWRAICRTSIANTTDVDTGIASTTVTTGDGVPYRFMIEADTTGAKFYIQLSEAGNLTNVANITTNVPTTTAMNAGVHFGRAQGVTAIGVDIYDMNVGWRKMLAR